MADYLDIKKLFSDSDLQDRVEVAVIIEANKLSTTVGATEPQKKWADEVFSNPRTAAKKVLMSVLAENSTATVAQITGATDAALQLNVAKIAGVFVDAKV